MECAGVEVVKQSLSGVIPGLENAQLFAIDRLATPLRASHHPVTRLLAIQLRAIQDLFFLCRYKQFAQSWCSIFLGGCCLEARWKATQVCPVIESLFVMTRWA